MGWMPMSFSSEVKEELAEYTVEPRHCLIAELSAMICMSARVVRKRKGYGIIFSTENIAAARKLGRYIERGFGYDAQYVVRCSGHAGKNHIYTVRVDDPKKAADLLLATKLMTPEEEPSEDLLPKNGLALKNDCCKRAFIRGAFLTSGSISDPEKFYHFEIVCSTMEKAQFLQGILVHFSFDARIVQRKKYYVVYIKEGEQIVDLLNVMMAHRALLELENLRVLKEVRNSVNRQVNCETANLNRTVSAAVKQIEDINYIKETIGLDSLSESLMEIAVLRAENTEVSLKELGQMLSPPVGKSGVNHRLRKISEIADELRQNEN